MRNQQQHQHGEQQRADQRRARHVKRRTPLGQPYDKPSPASPEWPDFAQQRAQHQHAGQPGAQRQHHLQQVSRDREKKARAFEQHVLVRNVDDAPESEHGEVGVKSVVAGGIANRRQRRQCAAQPGNRFL